MTLGFLGSFCKNSVIVACAPAIGLGFEYDSADATASDRLSKRGVVFALVRRIGVWRARSIAIEWREEQAKEAKAVGRRSTGYAGWTD